VTSVAIQPFQEALLDVFFANEELVINSIRENVLWQFANEPYVLGICAPLTLLFSNLYMIDSQWVIGCTV